MGGRKTTPKRTTRRTDVGDPRLGYEIRFLELTARGMRACRQLRVRTIRDFLQRDRDAFLQVRNCGDKTYDDIARRVRDFLSAQRQHTARPFSSHIDRPLQGWIDNPRAERAFRTLGITTFGEFLDTPKEDLLAVRGFGERTYWLVSQRISQLTELESSNWSILPQVFLDYSLDDLTLGHSLAAKLHDLEIRCISDLLSAPKTRIEVAVGPKGLDQLRTALGNLLRSGIDPGRKVDEAPEVDFSELATEILGVLSFDQRTLFTHRVGLNERLNSLKEIARRMEISIETARDLEEQTRVTLREKVPTFVARMHDDACREFQAHDGFLHAKQFTPGSLLYAAAAATGDPMLPLRIARFLFAGEFYLYGQMLLRLAPPVYRALLIEMKQSCAAHQLPMPVRQLKDRVSHIVDPAPASLLTHLARTRLRLRVQIDPSLGEVLQRDRQSTGDYLAQILDEAGRPRTLEDILFLYRDLRRVGNMKVLLDHLRADSRFIEVGRAIWSLRSEHEDELSLIYPIADEVIAEMLSCRRRQNLLDPDANADVPERRIYLLIACMREDKRVRYLGRGLFCVPGEKSKVMEDIRASMQRAMGEIVISLFLENQPRERRRLAQCLLHHNQALLSTSPDRIDMLSNYPLNTERKDRLFKLISDQLDKGRGYAPAAELLQLIRTTDLGGGWFSEYMLLDLLRRNTQLEILPGGIIAQPELGLAGWIQHRIRECLRGVGTPLTRDQVLIETPDIAEFERCIEDLIASDPMVQTIDGTHHTLV